MTIKYHIVTSGITSSIIYAVTNSIPGTIACFLAGVCIDADHLLDYYMNYGFTTRLGEIYRACAEHRLLKFYLVLHSYELLAVFWILIYLIPLNSVYLAAAIGSTLHMFLDQIYNPIYPKAYFLSYRISHKFDAHSFINPSK